MSVQPHARLRLGHPDRVRLSNESEYASLKRDDLGREGGDSPQLSLKYQRHESTHFVRKDCGCVTYGGSKLRRWR